VIQVSAPDVGPEEEALVLEVLRSGQLAQGPMVERLESSFRDLAGVAHAIAVSSGTAALIASMQALQLEPGDEVVTSPFTFVATLNAILSVGATAVFADIGDDFLIDRDSLMEACSSRTRVVMPVHLYGLASDMRAMEAAASATGATIVEDAAQAHGATFEGRPVGSWGIGCFSLYATKNVTTGEGGVVTTDDGTLADRIRLLRNQGMRERYRYELPGYNYRLTDLQAAVGIPQMDRLADRTRTRQVNAARLAAGLDGLPGVVVPSTPPGRTHVFHQFTIRVTDGARIDRDVLADQLRQDGVATGVYYPRTVFDYDCYRDHPLVRDAGTPNARRISDEVLSLPVHPRLSDLDIDRIIDRLRAALGG
jgi:perosamine synthetase